CSWHAADSCRQDQTGCHYLRYRVPSFRTDRHDRRIGGQKNAARPQAAPAGSLKPLPVSSVPLRRQSRNGPMNTQLLITLALLLASMMLFIRNKPRMDVVALLVIVALPLTEWCADGTGGGGGVQ